MSRKIEQPTFEGGDRGETIVRHPSFAQIGASRVSGSATLYGSDFKHQNFVRVRITKSELRRNLSTDWPYGSSVGYIEVDLSEAQWAEFVSSMNVGFGVQCTLRYRNGEEIPDLPEPERRIDQFDAEAREKLVAALSEMDALAAAIDELKVSEKQKAALRERVRMARQQLVSNVPFVLRLFGEHMETTVQKAKIEINAYATNAVMRAGIKALGGVNDEAPILSLSSGKEPS